MPRIFRSVAVLGAIVAFDLKAPTAAPMGIVGLFALFHGHADGAEIPEDAGGVAYAAGFMIATALLDLAGISAGFLIGKAGAHSAGNDLQSASAGQRSPRHVGLTGARSAPVSYSRSLLGADSMLAAILSYWSAKSRSMVSSPSCHVRSASCRKCSAR